MKCCYDMDCDGNDYQLILHIVFERRQMLNENEDRQRNEQSHTKNTLVVFDDKCDDLGDMISSIENHYEKEESIGSEEIEKKRKNQIKQKIQGYLSNRKSQGMTLKNNKLIDYDNEQPERALIDELGSIENVEKENRQLQRFILAFNKNPDNAINDYVKRSIIPDDEPESIAKYLIMVQGLDKALLGDYFGQNNPKVLQILHAYCKQFKFKNVEYDLAIRQLLSQFRLPGEAQQIQRIIWEFALAYYETNSELYDNADELFPLAYAIIMLATDAHNPKQQKKMSKEDFIKNTQRPCPSITAQYLSDVYDRITKQKFQTQNSYIETLYARLKDLSMSNLDEAFAFTKDLMKGDVFLKVCKNTNKFVQRKIYLSKDEEKIFWVCDPVKSQEEEPRFIIIRDIIDLTLGLGSVVMQKNKVPEHFDSLCFTIGTTYRTLDLKAKTNKERTKWVNYIRAILIQRRQQRKDEIEKHHQMNLSRFKIEELWNTEIFPEWDRHWDYKNKKPKEKSYIARGLQAICCCFGKKSKPFEGSQDSGNISGIKIKKSLLDSLWKLGLPENSRKTLWPLVIGNNLALTPVMIDQVKKRKKSRPQLKNYLIFCEEVRQMAEVVLQFRPDLPPIRDLILMSQIFYKAIPKNKNFLSLNGFINLIHMHHFLIFYRGEKAQIELRIQMFDFLLQKNSPKVLSHFKGLKLQTRMYLVSWFLSVFCDSFYDNEDFVLRIWDNFLLQGEIYLFKVGLSIIKYYEVELKMCTFHEGLELLRFPKATSPSLFFEILENEVEVREQYYHQYIEKRKHAIIKTKVQAIPLE